MLRLQVHPASPLAIHFQLRCSLHPSFNSAVAGSSRMEMTSFRNQLKIGSVDMLLASRGNVKLPVVSNVQVLPPL